METWGALRMSRKEVVRPGLLKALVAGQLSNRQVAAALRLSVRQVQRLRRRFQAAGVAGLVHRGRGQPLMATIRWPPRPAQSRRGSLTRCPTRACAAVSKRRCLEACLPNPRHSLGRSRFSGIKPVRRRVGHDFQELKIEVE